jgi:hypothetical protein
MRRSATKSLAVRPASNTDAPRQFISTVKSQIDMRHGFAGNAIRKTTYAKFDLQFRVVGPGQSDEALLQTLR